MLVLAAWFSVISVNLDDHLLGVFLRQAFDYFVISGGSNFLSFLDLEECCTVP
jgi:hypothetical protein